MLRNESKNGLTIFRDSVPASLFEELVERPNFVKVCAINNALKDIVWHDIPSTNTSEIGAAAELDCTGFAEGMEVGLQSKVDTVSLVVCNTAAFWLLFGLQ